MAMTLITTNTSSDAATSDFTSGIDNTYKLYIFKFYAVNPATNGADFTFDTSTDGGSNYASTKTTTYFRAKHNEDDSATELAYKAGDDLAQSPNAQKIAPGIGSGADESCAGTLWLFNPSNTTYVKHFYSTMNLQQDGGISDNVFVAGYINQTTDIDAVQFAMSSGNMDALIKMYGVG